MRKELVNEDLAQEKGLVVDLKIPPSSCAERSEQRSKQANADLVQILNGLRRRGPNQIAINPQRN